MTEIRQRRVMSASDGLGGVAGQGDFLKKVPEPRRQRRNNCIPTEEGLETPRQLVGERGSVRAPQAEEEMTTWEKTRAQRTTPAGFLPGGKCKWAPWKDSEKTGSPRSGTKSLCHAEEPELSQLVKGNEGTVQKCRGDHKRNTCDRSVTSALVGNGDGISSQGKEGPERREQDIGAQCPRALAELSLCAGPGPLIHPLPGPGRRAVHTPWTCGLLALTLSTEALTSPPKSKKHQQNALPISAWPEAIHVARVGAD